MWGPYSLCWLTSTFINIGPEGNLLREILWYLSAIVLKTCIILFHFIMHLSLRYKTVMNPLNLTYQGDTGLEILHVVLITLYIKMPPKSTGKRKSILGLQKITGKGNGTPINLALVIGIMNPARYCLNIFGAQRVKKAHANKLNGKSLQGRKVYLSSRSRLYLYL